MDLSTTSLVGIVVGAVVGFIFYKVVFGWIQTSVCKIDRPETERQASERGLAAMRPIMMVGETAIGAFIGYWVATYLL